MSEAEKEPSERECAGMEGESQKEELVAEQSMWDLAQYPFAERAFELAREALAAGEVPIGCVFAYFPEPENDKDVVEPVIIGEGYNSPNQTRNPTRHAEINAVDKAIEWASSKGIPLERLWKRTSAIVTVEPCVMCASALLSLGFQHVHYGCRNDRFGGCGSVLDVPEFFGPEQGSAENPAVCTKFVGGWRAEEAMSLLKDFYKGENPHAPEDKVKRKKRNKTTEDKKEPS